MRQLIGGLHIGIGEQFNPRAVVAFEIGKQEPADRVLLKVGRYGADFQPAAGISNILMRLDQPLQRLGVTLVPQAVLRVNAPPRRSRGGRALAAKSRLLWNGGMLRA